MTSCTVSICVPDFCKVNDIPFQPCVFIKAAPVTFENLYSTIYMGTQAVPLITEGIPTKIQDDLTWLFFRIAFVQTLPYIIMFAVLFIVMMRARLVSFDVGIMMIVLIVVLAVISVAWILFYVDNVIVDLISQVGTMLTDNWNKNKAQIGCNLYEAWIDPAYVACKTDTLQKLSDDVREIINRNGGCVSGGCGGTL
jgi:hypothetical protein